MGWLKENCALDGISDSMVSTSRCADGLCSCKLCCVAIGCDTGTFWGSLTGGTGVKVPSGRIKWVRRSALSKLSARIPGLMAYWESLENPLSSGKTKDQVGVGYLPLFLVLTNSDYENLALS